ncbi:MAG: hypothetical protein CSA05_00030 [Bacteroidia bacterium]|nr:MAG: hypothetical protein CSB01_00905 [Bacteroidia bacterium]PIE86515.1 MAG: hypothetical protein CSA05_00030 [Bacteroidia bacterium]
MNKIIISLALILSFSLNLSAQKNFKVQKIKKTGPPETPTRYETCALLVIYSRLKLSFDSNNRTILAVETPKAGKERYELFLRPNEKQIITIQSPGFIETNIDLRSPILGNKHVRYYKITEEQSDKNFFCFNIWAGPSYGLMSNDKIKNTDSWDLSGKISYQFHAIASYYFRKYIGFGLGIGISSYGSEISLNNFSNENNPNIKGTDKDGENYLKIVNANFTETYSLKYFDIPILIRSGNVSFNRFSFYFDIGFQYSMLLNSTYEISGTSEHKGYYPQYANVILDELPEYGYTKKNINISDDWEINKTKLSFLINTGLYIPIKEKTSISLGVSYSKGLSDLNYNKAKHRDDFIKLVGKPDKTQLNSYSIQLGLCFKF